MKKGVVTMLFMFLFLTIGSVVTLTGCGSCFGDDGGLNVRIEDMTASLSEILYNGDLNYYNLEPPSNVDASISFDSVGIELNFETRAISLNDKVTTSFSITGAYACSPVTNIVDKIKKMSIVSDVDYDELHKSGSNLIDIMEVSFSPSSKFSINEFIMDNSIYYESGYMFLIFSNPPDVENPNTFTLEITLEDERVFTTQLDPIIIKP